MDTLSQLIRTSFIAGKGNFLIDADFSSIEARIKNGGSKFLERTAKFMRRR